jgi:hypothetical protein
MIVKVINDKFIMTKKILESFKKDIFWDQYKINQNHKRHRDGIYVFLSYIL